MSKIKYIENEILFYLNYFLHGIKAKTILFYPEYPHKRTIIYKILKHLKFNMTNNPKHKFDLAFSWEDTTFRKKQTVLERFNPNKIINLNCTDISKERISDSFKKVFKYDLEVDPTSYKGECVMKNNLNAKHDGFIIKCPVNNLEEGYVYQKVLNNIVDDKLVMDIRVPILNEEIPLVYLKYKLIEDRFTNDIVKSQIASVNEYITEEEIRMIKEFCNVIGLDYGELDVLRNNNDRKIYIVDVNYTPWGPPGKLSEDESRMAVIRMAEMFRKIYFN